MILDRQVADPLPGRGKDRVAESGRRGGDTGFAHSSRRSFAWNNIHKDLFGRLAHFGDVEGIEIRLHGASLLEGKLAKDGLGASKDGCAFTLS